MIFNVNRLQFCGYVSPLCWIEWKTRLVICAFLVHYRVLPICFLLRGLITLIPCILSYFFTQSSEIRSNNTIFKFFFTVKIMWLHTDSYVYCRSVQLASCVYWCIYRSHYTVRFCSICNPLSWVISPFRSCFVLNWFHMHFKAVYLLRGLVAWV